jgi:hypothetical protein
MAKARTKDEEDPRRPTPVARDGAYVMMLFVTLVALIAGCVLLYLDNDEYAGKAAPKEGAPKVQALGSAAKVEAGAPTTTPGAPPMPGAGGPGAPPGMP